MKNETQENSCPHCGKNESQPDFSESLAGIAFGLVFIAIFLMMTN